MTDQTPDISFDETVAFLTQQAAQWWGEAFAEQRRELLEQAAHHIVSIANSLPETETEPGFYQ